MQLPRFFLSATHSIAIHQGAGSNLAQNISDIMTAYDRYAHNIHAFGLLVNADEEIPALVARRYADKLRPFFPHISSIPGHIVSGKPRAGIYVLPDNVRPGTLDTLLTSCAEVAYPHHKAGALNYLQFLDGKVNISHLTLASERDKAVVACIVSVIHPGIANTLSLERDNWICDETVSAISEVAQLLRFLQELLQIEAT